MVKVLLFNFSEVDFEGSCFYVLLCVCFFGLRRRRGWVVEVEDRGGKRKGGKRRVDADAGGHGSEGGRSHCAVGA